MTKEERIERFQEVQIISKYGFFTQERFGRNEEVKLPFSPKELREAIYISKEEAAALACQKTLETLCVPDERKIHLWNNDTSGAVSSIQSWAEWQDLPGEGNVLALNFGNPVRPGGDVAKGFEAQEEDLCLRTTLYASLSSKSAKPYYQNHLLHRSPMASDAMLISPNVARFDHDLTTFSVLTCSAPSAVMQGNMTDEEYEALLYQRIMAMLHVAAHYGYKRLVLGAWGCGVYQNNPTQIARLFYKAFQNIRHDGKEFNALFEIVVFAILVKGEDKQTYKAFRDVLYPKPESAKLMKTASETRKPDEKRKQYLNQIRGSLIGGAVGDALGYPVEFLGWKQIQKKYGPDGIQEYTLDFETGEALFSDDTQMTLYTANGLLYGDTHGSLRGIMGSMYRYVTAAYRDWYKAQHDRDCTQHGDVSWLSDLPEMHARRAPGNTCLSALSSYKTGALEYGLFCNNSKGCGGMMRVAPVGLFYSPRDEKEWLWIDRLGAEVAAITHGHPLGYIPAAMMTHIINIGVYGNCSRGNTLLDAVEDSLDAIRGIFPKEEAALNTLEALTRKAIALAEEGGDDEANIRVLGQGWVAEEALAIALYCCLRYPKDFSKAIIASVNHSGDSDSTGSITGNILGAWLGYDAIEEKWLKNLERKSIILEVADDLCYGCQMDEYSSFRDSIWECKYIYGRYAKTEGQADEIISDAMI